MRTVGPNRTFPVDSSVENGCIEQYTVVALLSTGTIIPCPADGTPLGVTATYVEPGTGLVAVTLLNAQGTCPVRVSGTVAVGDKLIVGADGVAQTGEGDVIGVALQAAAGGGVVEFAPSGIPVDAAPETP